MKPADRRKAKSKATKGDCCVNMRQKNFRLASSNRNIIMHERMRSEACMRWREIWNSSNPAPGECQWIWAQMKISLLFEMRKLRRNKRARRRRVCKRSCSVFKPFCPFYQWSGSLNAKYSLNCHYIKIIGSERRGYGHRNEEINQSAHLSI